MNFAAAAPVIPNALSVLDLVLSLSFIKPDATCPTPRAANGSAVAIIAALRTPSSKLLANSAAFSETSVPNSSSVILDKSVLPYFSLYFFARVSSNALWISEGA